jgi:hypothetical protein
MRGAFMSGYIHYLVGLPSSSPSGLPRVIKQIQDTSTQFCTAWKAHNAPEAKKASFEAMQAFDYVCNVFLRARDDAKSQNRYDGDLKQFMDSLFGQLVSSATLAELRSNAGAIENLGKGCLPVRKTPPINPPFHSALNKIKHRDNAFSNFRISHNRHFLTLGGDVQTSRSYIFEFDVAEFCDLCNSGVDLVK